MSSEHRNRKRECSGLTSVSFLGPSINFTMFKIPFQTGTSFKTLLEHGRLRDEENPEGPPLTTEPQEESQQQSHEQPRLSHELTQSQQQSLQHTQQSPLVVQKRPCYEIEVIINQTNNQPINHDINNFLSHSQFSSDDEIPLSQIVARLKNPYSPATSDEPETEQSRLTSDDDENKSDENMLPQSVEQSPLRLEPEEDSDGDENHSLRIKDEEDSDGDENHSLRIKDEEDNDGDENHSLRIKDEEDSDGDENHSLRIKDEEDSDGDEHHSLRIKDEEDSDGDENHSLRIKDEEDSDGDENHSLRIKVEEDSDGDENHSLRIKDEEVSDGDENHSMRIKVEEDSDDLQSTHDNSHCQRDADCIYEETMYKTFEQRHIKKENQPNKQLTANTIAS